MDYITVKEAANKWKVTERCVQNYCSSGKINGAIQIGKQWLVPNYIEKPSDRRKIKEKGYDDLEPYHFPILVFTGCYNSRAYLNEDEKELLDAQILYFKGQYLESVIKCRKIIDRTDLSYILIGCYATIIYSSIFLGLHTEYTQSLSTLKQLVNKDTIHKADYNLIVKGILFHEKRNPIEVKDVDFNSIGNEAIYYYEYVLLISMLLKRQKFNDTILRYFSMVLRKVENEGIDILSLQMHCILSGFYNKINNKEESERLMDKACDFTIKNNMFTALSKYYVADSEIINKSLLKYKDRDYISIMREAEYSSMKNWHMIYQISTGTDPFVNVSFVEKEILVLLSYDIPIENISIVMNMREDDVNKKIEIIMNIYNISSFEELVDFSKKTLEM